MDGINGKGERTRAGPGCLGSTAKESGPGQGQVVWDQPQRIADQSRTRLDGINSKGERIREGPGWMEAEVKGSGLGQDQVG